MRNLRGKERKLFNKWIFPTRKDKKYPLQTLEQKRNKKENQLI